MINYEKTMAMDNGGCGLVTKAKPIPPAQEWGLTINRDTNSIHVDRVTLLEKIQRLQALKDTNPTRFITNMADILEWVLPIWNVAITPDPKAKVPLPLVGLDNIFPKEFIEQFNTISPLKLGDRVEKDKARKMPARVSCDGQEFPINGPNTYTKRENPIAMGGSGTLRRIESLRRKVSDQLPEMIVKKTYLNNLKQGERITKLNPTPLSEALRDAYISQKLDHPCILGPETSIIAPNSKGSFTVYSFMPRNSGPDLFDAIDPKPKKGQPVSRFLTLVCAAPSWPAVDQKIMINSARQIAEALAHMHEQGIVHGDMKPENILVDKGPGGLRLRLVDFGYSIFTADKDSALMPKGTVAYCSPEKATRRPETLGMTTASDAWALGILIIELFAATNPFEVFRNEDVIRVKIAAHKSSDTPTYLEKIKLPFLEQTDRLKALIVKLLHEDPAKRATAHEAAIELREIAEKGAQ